jgi:hypothetical protein
MARDKIHDAVKNALIKDGWTITHDPLELEFRRVNIEIDLAAHKPFAAQKADRKIAVEIKSFLSRSGVYDFERALGQYILYRTYLEEIDPTRHLYLAVSNFTYRALFQRGGIDFVVQKMRMAIVVVNLPHEEVIEWID